MDVIVRDVSDPSKVERAVDDLSTNSRVAAIIGPLVSSTAVEAARDAQQRSIPIVTLTQKDGITGTGDFVFRKFLTPSAQAAAVARRSSRYSTRRTTTGASLRGTSRKRCSAAAERP